MSCFNARFICRELLCKRSVSKNDSLKVCLFVRLMANYNFEQILVIQQLTAVFVQGCIFLRTKQYTLWVARNIQEKLAPQYCQLAVAASPNYQISTNLKLLNNDQIKIANLVYVTLLETPQIYLQTGQFVQIPQNTTESLEAEKQYCRAL